MERIARELLKAAKELTSSDKERLYDLMDDYSKAVPKGIEDLLKRESEKLEKKLKKFIGYYVYWANSSNSYGVLRDVKVTAKKGYGVTVMLETGGGKEWIHAPDFDRWYFTKEEEKRW